MGKKLNFNILFPQKNTCQADGIFVLSSFFELSQFEQLTPHSKFWPKW
jgi:hypothetical protein